ncbi:MAG: TIR domain-containing protein [Oscillospiraceae bacterium]
MPKLFDYHVFISHAWKYGDEYDRLVRLLDNASNFAYYNYSAPAEKPLQNLNSTDVTTKNQIKAAIDRKISASSCVLVISGMYTAYREWMQYEIDSAKSMRKPIIAIRPWGSQVMPTVVSLAATEIVGWNTDSVISAIRRHS